jgi:hypothetical protein
MPVSRRFSPEKPPGETCRFGIDFSTVIPIGEQIESGTIDIFTNAATPQPADADWVKGSVEIRGRVLYAQLGGGVSGTDYQLRFSVRDSAGNVWPRTALILVSETS